MLKTYCNFNSFWIDTERLRRLQRPSAGRVLPCTERLHCCFVMHTRFRIRLQTVFLCRESLQTLFGVHRASATSAETVCSSHSALRTERHLRCPHLTPIPGYLTCRSLPRTIPLRHSEHMCPYPHFTRRLVDMRCSSIRES